MGFALEDCVDKSTKPLLMLDCHPTKEKFSLGVFIVHLECNIGGQVYAAGGVDMAVRWY